MTANALRPAITADPDRPRFPVTNTGIGHAFPTYVTPGVTLHAVPVDKTTAPWPARNGPP